LCQWLLGLIDKVSDTAVDHSHRRDISNFSEKGPFFTFFTKVTLTDTYMRTHVHTSLYIEITQSSIHALVFYEKHGADSRTNFSETIFLQGEYSHRRFISYALLVTFMLICREKSRVGAPSRVCALNLSLFTSPNTSELCTTLPTENQI
jgi:hypothetical protein